MSIELYNYLTVYGDVYETTFKLDKPKDFIKWSENNFKYVQYNPRKSIQRLGLSITSLNGQLSGIPDLDSLAEYNKENNTNYKERDFAIKTKVYYYPDLEKILHPVEKHIFRSHVIKLLPGGFFPAHRDFSGTQFENYRALIPLDNLNPPSFYFLVDGKIQHWQYGALYFVNTAKCHVLFNASVMPSYVIVLNIDLNIDTVNYLTKNLKHRA